MHSSSTGYSDKTYVENTVASLNEDATIHRDDWVYRVEGGPRYYFISVYDETGRLLGQL